MPTRTAWIQPRRHNRDNRHRAAPLHPAIAHRDAKFTFWPVSGLMSEAGTSARSPSHAPFRALAQWHYETRLTQSPLRGQRRTGFAQTAKCTDFPFNPAACEQAGTGRWREITNGGGNKQTDTCCLRKIQGKLRFANKSLARMAPAKEGSNRQRL